VWTAWAGCVSAGPAAGCLPLLQKPIPSSPTRSRGTSGRGCGGGQQGQAHSLLTQAARPIRTTAAARHAQALAMSGRAAARAAMAAQHLLWPLSAPSSRSRRDSATASRRSTTGRRAQRPAAGADFSLQAGCRKRTGHFGGPQLDPDRPSSSGLGRGGARGSAAAPATGSSARSGSS